MSMNNPFQASPQGFSQPAAPAKRTAPPLYMVIAIAMIVLSSIGLLSGLCLELPGLVAGQMMNNAFSQMDVGGDPEQQKMFEATQALGDKYFVSHIISFGMSLLVNIFWLAAAIIGLRGSSLGKNLMVVALIGGVLVAGISIMMQLIESFDTFEVQKEMMTSQGASEDQLAIFSGVLYTVLGIVLCMRVPLILLYLASAGYLVVSKRVAEYVR